MNTPDYENNMYQNMYMFWLRAKRKFNITYENIIDTRSLVRFINSFNE